MSFWTKEELKKFHCAAYRRKERLEKSDVLGCFYCASIFDYSAVMEFLRTNDLALCPICGTDAVIPLSDIPEEKWASLLLAMYLEYFGESEMTLGELMQKHFYLYQVPNQFQEKINEKMEAIFDRSKRQIEHNIYAYYGYTQSYTVPIYNEKLIIYPLSYDFVERMLPAFYSGDDLPAKSIPIMKKIVEEGPFASFLIEIPGSLEERKAEHLVKLLGMAFGGYFSKLSDLPADGKLTKEEHIFIRPYPKKDYDILGQLESLLEKLG